MNGYPYQNNQFLQNLMLQQTAPQEVVKVNGVNGVNAYQMAPNSSALLLDTTASMVWLVQTDGAGYKTSTPYDITPHQSEDEVQYKSLEERISKLEEVINAKSNAKPITRESEQQHTNAGNRSNDAR